MSDTDVVSHGDAMAAMVDEVKQRDAEALPVTITIIARWYAKGHPDVHSIRVSDLEDYGLLADAKDAIEMARGVDDE